MLISQKCLSFLKEPTSEELALNPKGYTGLYSFHKYWGKKPSETIRFLIEKLSAPSDIVCDPFVGSGVCAVEALSCCRRVIGIDLNPIAIEISRFLAKPPDLDSIKSTFQNLKSMLETKINESYTIEHPFKTATHCLWQEGTLKAIWTKKKGSRGRIELSPQKSDLELSNSFQNYQPRLLPKPIFFNNSRINSHSRLQSSDLFTGRALRNVELLLDAILQIPSVSLRDAFLLCLTASSGQMSKMVFAITNRGKTTGNISTKIEVGSWVIGYWRPKFNFEINVWNCFQGKAVKLINTLAKLNGANLQNDTTIASNPLEVISGKSSIALVLGDALDALCKIPSNSIHLILTDPPHSDRIPYLELSEMWNTILKVKPDYEQEIVVSNAKDRGKTKEKYNQKMAEFLDIACKKLTPGGILALIYNARGVDSWKYLNKAFLKEKGGLGYLGFLPLNYSANSVVQDNRVGSLEGDYVLIFKKTGHRSDDFNPLDSLKSIRGWSNDFPK